MNRLINLSRRWLIYLGKMLPFLFCAIVFVSYTETLFNVVLSHYYSYGEYIIVNKDISRFIASYIEYDWSSVIVLAIISIAIETCYWNKLAVVYLALQLLEKTIIYDYEFTPMYACVIALANMMVSGYLVYRGIKVLMK